MYTNARIFIFTHKKFWKANKKKQNKTKHKNGDFEVKCHNHVIKSSNQVKYLGVRIDKFLKGTYIIEDIIMNTKRRRSDPVLWQKPLHQQKCQKGKVTTQTTPQKSSIKQQLRTDLGRSVGVTTATQLVWLTGLRAHLPTPRNSRVIKRTHI